MEKRNIKENLISKEYDNNKKGKTLLKLIINGETLFDTKENELIFKTIQPSRKIKYH